MKKETIIAIILGVMMGAVVAIVLVLQTKKDEKPKVIPIAPNARVTPVTAKGSSSSNATFEVSEPTNEKLTEEKTITIKGKAEKESLIVVQSAAGFDSIKNDKEDFTIEDFPLTQGENTINVSVYTQESNATPQELVLKVYSIQE